MKKYLISGLSKPKLLVLLILAAIYNIADAQLVFKTSIQTLDASGYEYSIADLNKDSFPDIYISGHFGGISAGHPGYIWMNNGDGSFTSKQTIGYPAVAHRVAFADLDADGDIDLFLANDASYADATGSDPKYYPGCPNEVWLNDGMGNFTNSGQLLGFEPSNKVILADVDGDGDIDAVVGNYHPGGTITDLKYKPDEVWLNDGNGNFTLSQKFGYGMASPILVDLDTDMDLDIVDGDTIYYNVNGIFTKSTNTFQGKGNYASFGDIDNDGDMDTFLGTDWGETAELWLNDGTSNFIDSEQQVGVIGNIQFLDTDDDGDLDMFFPGNGLWVNQGGEQGGTIGTFLKSNLSFPSGNGVLCDFNNDGKLDAFIDNKIWINEYVETTVNEINDNNKVIISPNPTSGVFTISIGTTTIDEALVTIYNLQGTQVFSKTFQNTPSATIDLTGYPAGIYMVNVIADGVSYEEKIVKK